MEFEEEVLERLAAGRNLERLPGFLAEFPDRLPTRLEPERPLRLAAGCFLFFVGAVFSAVVLFVFCLVGGLAARAVPTASVTASGKMKSR